LQINWEIWEKKNIQRCAVELPVNKKIEVNFPCA
jgi:hypothetical protein